MRLQLDPARCEAHGQCVLVAPDLFELGDDDEVATVLDEHPDDSLRSQAQAAVYACPAFAISLTNEG